VVRVHVLTVDDWRVWREVRLAVLTEAPHAFKSRLADWESGGEERWRARLEMPDSYNIVAWLDDRAVGIASGIPGENGVRELRSVWVSPEARGRQVGDRLIAAVEDWAVRSNAMALSLAVIPGNQSAIALYRRNGFIVTEEFGALLPDGVTREQVMRKSLGAGFDGAGDGSLLTTAEFGRSRVRTVSIVEFGIPARSRFWPASTAPTSSHGPVSPPRAR
jgi:ribosomal protein S18 acetylase RimI-like enzyme